MAQIAKKKKCLQSGRHVLILNSTKIPIYLFIFCSLIIKDKMIIYYEIIGALFCILLIIMYYFHGHINITYLIVEMRQNPIKNHCTN